MMCKPPKNPRLQAPVLKKGKGKPADNRTGRLKEIKTDRGVFRTKDNRMGGD